MKAVMYHYVRPVDARLPRLRALHIDDFRRQLDHFQETFGFVSKDDFLGCFTGGPIPREGVVLTFDDGVKDHHDWVLPELVERGLWGIFYVPTGQFETGQLLSVHRIHELLARFDSEVVAENLSIVLNDEAPHDETLAAYQGKTYLQQDEQPAMLWVKRVLNYAAPPKSRSTLLDRLYDRLLLDGGIGADEFYMNREEIGRLADAGMIVGCHSRQHHVLSQLSEEQQRDEIESSFAIIEGIVPARPRTFCYPYGGFHTFTETTERLLTEADVLFSFNVEERDITAADIKGRPQALPRYDCNHFDHGQARSIEWQLRAVQD